MVVGWYVILNKMVLGVYAISPYASYINAVVVFARKMKSLRGMHFGHKPSSGQSNWPSTPHVTLNNGLKESEKK